jgi:hypothetical protein
MADRWILTLQGLGAVPADDLPPLPDAPGRRHLLEFARTTEGRLVRVFGPDPDDPAPRGVRPAPEFKPRPPRRVRSA